MKRSINMKIVWLSLLLIAIIFASITFGTFEGMDTMLTEEEQKRMMMSPEGGMMPTEGGMMPSTAMQAGFRSR